MCQHTTTDMMKATEAHVEESEPQDLSLLSVSETSSLVFTAANWTLLAWSSLLLVLYSITPSEELVYLSSSERQTALMALFALVVAFLSTLCLFAIHKKFWDGRGANNGIVYAAFVVKFIAISTNAILAYCPVVVRIDVVTHAPVYLVRWCEWVCLAGLLTFLSEAVELKRDTSSIRNAIIASGMQSLSCLTGGIFCAYVTTTTAWIFHMTVSFLTYFVIFGRVYIKRNAFRSFINGETYYGRKERYDRLRFSYTLLATCSVTWTVLVVLYFVNMYIHRALPDTHWIRLMAPTMMCDAFFDVTSKALYMKCIVEVHFAVFDSEGRARRQLSELRSLMSVLWNQSSDVILVSASHDNKIVSIFSPSFLPLILGGTDDKTKQNRTALNSKKDKGKALMMEMDREQVLILDNPQLGEGNMTVSKAAYVDTATIPYEGWGAEWHQVPGSHLDASDFVALNGKSIVAIAWNKAARPSDGDGGLVTYPFQTKIGESRTSEVKVSTHGENAIVCVIRDVTERYRRFEAENRVHEEVVRRQKDSQAQTRFVRHEVKNGLLAGIELCDSLKDEIGARRNLVSTGQSDVDLHNSSKPLFDIAQPLPISARQPARKKFTKKAENCVGSLDLLLHEILETVLAETMARDVVNEIYKPRPENVDVLATLLTSSTRRGKSRRFPIEVKGETIPFLQLDTHLFRYIHWNALSNAAKYGMPGGEVNTVLSYESGTNILTMNVVNEPDHEDQERIMKLDKKEANDIVFAQGSTLHCDACVTSSGDGAWIIAKCAKAMGGTCSISFEKEQTVFSFQAKVEPVLEDAFVSIADFTVPANTIGIAIDDSKIQRKIMHRMLSYLGVHGKRTIVIGETANEVLKLKDILLRNLRDHPESNILMLVDENLDYGSRNTEQARTSMISGSRTMEIILNELTKDQASRILVLVRSANDSARDLALYTKRTHGFIPKAPIHKQKVRELLAPFWAERFMHQSS